MKKKSMAAAVVLGLGLSMAAPAMATTTTFYFDGVNANEAYLGGAAGQLFLDVTSTSSDDVLLTFWNKADTGIQSSLTNVYFDWSAAYGGISIAGQSGGVSMSLNANPANFPEGNTLVPSFATDVSASKNQGNENGVNHDVEWVTFTYAGVGYSNILGLLDGGDFRVGLHLTGFASGGSDSYVNGGCIPGTPNCPETGGGEGTVPLPGAAWLFGTALLGFVAKAGRRRV